MGMSEPERQTLPHRAPYTPWNGVNAELPLAGGCVGERLEQVGSEVCVWWGSPPRVCLGPRESKGNERHV